MLYVVKIFVGNEIIDDNFDGINEHLTRLKLQIWQQFNTHHCQQKKLDLKLQLQQCNL